MKKRYKTADKSEQPTRVILFNKPYGTLCQFSGEPKDSLLSDFISVPGVYAAGRLDKDSEGLLVLTNNGKLQHSITHPSKKSPKSYWVQVEGSPSEAQLSLLRTGVELNDGITAPAEVDTIAQPSHLWQRHPPIRERKNIPDAWLNITLTEGRNRQVRRMTAAVGLPTLRLIRHKVGKWSLESLAPGEYREV